MKDRRNLLKVAALTGAAGATWKKPVVDAVVLPAHAETSVSPLTGFTDILSSNQDPFESEGYVDSSSSPLDLLVDTAHALPDPVPQWMAYTVRAPEMGESYRLVEIFRTDNKIPCQTESIWRTYVNVDTRVGDKWYSTLSEGVSTDDSCGPRARTVEVDIQLSALDDQISPTMGDALVVTNNLGTLKIALGSGGIPFSLNCNTCK